MQVKDSRGRRLLRAYVQAHFPCAASFAKTAHITQASLSRILRGKVRPNYANMRAIAQATRGAVPVEAWLE